MFRYIARRILWTIPLMVGVTALVFFLVNAIPGSPVNANPEQTGGGIADAIRLRKLLGLDQPVWKRYFIWLGHLVRGDMGTSFISHQSVTHDITTRLASTFELALSAFILAAVIAIPLGALAAVREGGMLDRVVNLTSVVGVSVPAFWIGLLMVIYFSTRLHWFPAGGDGPIFGGGFVARVHYLILPAVTVAIPLIAEWLRYVRNRMLEVLPLEYLRSARSKGLRERTVIMKHAFRNASLPLIQLLGLSLPTFFAGALMVETVFNRSGIGRLTYDAAIERDYPVVMGTVVVVGCLVVLGNLLADVLTAISDPRIRVG